MKLTRFNILLIIGLFVSSVTISSVANEQLELLKHPMGERPERPFLPPGE